MMSSMADNVGLVHQMPFVCDKHGFAGVLEKVKVFLYITINLCNDKMYSNYSSKLEVLRLYVTILYTCDAVYHYILVSVCE